MNTAFSFLTHSKERLDYMDFNWTDCFSPYLNRDAHGFDKIQTLAKGSEQELWNLGG